MPEQELFIRKIELMRLRWRLANGRVRCDPEVIPAACDWLSGEIAQIDQLQKGK